VTLYAVNDIEDVEHLGLVREATEAEILASPVVVAALAAAEAEVVALRKTLDDPALVEALADSEHDRWSGWHRHLRRLMHEPGRMERWDGLSETPYADLDEPTKEYDRIEARRTIEIVRDHQATTPEPVAKKATRKPRKTYHVDHQKIPSFWEQQAGGATSRKGADEYVDWLLDPNRPWPKRVMAVRVRCLQTGEIVRTVNRDGDVIDTPEPVEG
jgi:hypothetical protein